MLVRIGANWHAVEVGVTHPLRKSIRILASMRQGAAAEAKVAEKHRKYDEVRAAKEPKRILTAVETYTGSFIHSFIRSQVLISFLFPP